MTGIKYIPDRSCWWLIITTSKIFNNAAFKISFASGLVKICPSATLVGWIQMKTVFQQIFLAHRTTLFPKVTENKFIVSNYRFSDPTRMYLFEFSNNNSTIKCKICSKLTIEALHIVLLSLLLTMNIFGTFHFCWLWTCKCWI